MNETGNVTQQSPMSQQMGKLDQHVTELENKLDILVGRLQPVLSKEGAENASEEKDRKELAPFCEKILAVRKRIGFVNGRIDDILERLEI